MYGRQPAGRELNEESALLFIKINELGLEMAVTEILHFIGMPAHIRGYRFMCEAILMAVNDRTPLLWYEYIYPALRKSTVRHPQKVSGDAPRVGDRLGTRLGELSDGKLFFPQRIKAQKQLSS
jgi:hypothetical protein